MTRDDIKELEVQKANLTHLLKVYTDESERILKTIKHIEKTIRNIDLQLKKGAD